MLRWMESLTALLQAHGYKLLFVVGFVEFAGLPVASAPVLVLAGAFAARGALELPVAIGVAVLGGLTADLLWYGLARRRGGRVLGLACGLANNPAACTGSLRARIERLGSRSVLASKLVPGLANLTAAAAGLARVSAPRFLVADVAGLVFWASVSTGLGWLFADQVEEALAWLASYTRAVLFAGGTLIAVAAAWRILKARRHRRVHVLVAEPLGLRIMRGERP